MAIGTGIQLTTGFDVNTGLPLDSRSVVANITERDAIPATMRYVGMKTTVLDDGNGEQITFKLVGANVNTAVWEVDGGGGSGSGFISVADIAARNGILADDRVEGSTVVYVTSEKTTYQLIGGITDADWKVLGHSYNSIATKTLSATLLNSESIILVNATTANIDLTLPTWSLGKSFEFKRIDNNPNYVVRILTPNASTYILSEEGLLGEFTLPYFGNKLKLVGIYTDVWGTF